MIQKFIHPFFIYIMPIKLTDLPSLQQQVANLALNGLNKVRSATGNPTFIWKEETFICTANTLHDKIDNSIDAGTSEDADFRMTVPLNQFTPGIYPALNDFITYDGYNLLVKDISKPSHGIFWVYILALPNVN